MQRRELLRALSGAVLAGGLPAVAEAADAARPKPLGKAQPFDYAWLKAQARALAGVAYLAPTTKLPEALRDLDYDRYQMIRYRADRALWADDDLQFQVRLFHAGLFFNQPVRVHEVVNGIAQELAYDPKLFDFGKSGVRADRLPKDFGFAGFRVLFHTDLERDVAAWLGASYFRAVGGDWQYGLSSRGLAIDTGATKGEEFPRFSAFWLEKPRPESNHLVIYALLDSPSIAGAYRFEIVPGATQTMEVDAALYPRRPIERLGIAPCTSMYQVGENDRRLDYDFRPEIHDSDGLAMANGSGEWIWRPLVNPTGIRTNTFGDKNPRGFGLLQRDHNFDHYQDDGAYYDKRPSLWVEPKGDWGAGSVQLVELPTADETNDNIVAFWNPEEKPQPGQELLFAYRLHWGRNAPVAPKLATVQATRTGLGGIVGHKRTYFSWRFVVDFVGGDLALLGKETKIEPIISSSRGLIELATTRPLKEISGWRAVFDLKLTDESLEPIDLRLFLRAGGQGLSETWLYQYTPPPILERRY
ncbi:MAG: glucan biosynthesis protein D [Nevskia sp.]